MTEPKSSQWLAEGDRVVITRDGTITEYQAVEVHLHGGGRVSVELQPIPKCEGFQWIGQPWTSCDRCGRPVWEHQGLEWLREGASPFEADNMEIRLFQPGEQEALRRRHEPKRRGAPQPGT